MSLDEAIEHLAEDELLEVTPESHPQAYSRYRRARQADLENLGAVGSIVKSVLKPPKIYGVFQKVLQKISARPFLLQHVTLIVELLSEPDALNTSILYDALWPALSSKESVYVVESAGKSAASSPLRMTR